MAEPDDDGIEALERIEELAADLINFHSLAALVAMHALVTAGHSGQIAPRAVALADELCQALDKQAEEARGQDTISP
jgi:hypothetical protein